MDLKGMKLDKNLKDEVMVKNKDSIKLLSNFWTYCCYIKNGKKLLCTHFEYVSDSFPPQVNLLHE